MSKNNLNLLEEFSHVQKLLSKYQLWHYRKFGPSGNPHRGQGRVLAILKLQPEISQKELSYLLDMRNQSLGELLFKLERSGAITREPSEDDRRGMNIKLTESGVKLIEEGGKKPDDVSRIFDCLSSEDRIKLHEILGSLSEELEKLLGPDEAFDKAQTDEKGSKHSRNGEAGRPGQKLSSDDERNDIKRRPREIHHEKQKEGAQK